MLQRILENTQKKLFTPTVSLEAGNKIKVKIKNQHDSDKDYEYEFELKKGENFYFIISQKVGEETYVTTN